MMVSMLWLMLGTVGPTFGYPIYNGQDEDSFDAVVSLGVQVGDDVMSMCTGTIITKRVILTAGHCGEGVDPEMVVEFGRAFVGPVASDAQYVLELADAATHTDYLALEGNDLGAYDAGILVLAEDAPVDPMRIRLDEFTDDDQGAEVLSVGYGVTGASQNDGGVKRSALLTIDSITDQFLISRSITNESRANVCSGDSGGPQLFDEDGEWVQWAIHSWADSTCQNRSGSQRMDLILDWVLEEVEAAHGTADLCEARGQYGDGTCDAYCDVDPDCVADTGYFDESPTKGGGCACGSVGERFGGVWLVMGGALMGLLRRKHAISAG